MNNKKFNITEYKSLISELVKKESFDIHESNNSKEFSNYIKPFKQKFGPNIIINKVLKNEYHVTVYESVSNKLSNYGKNNALDAYKNSWLPNGDNYIHATSTKIFTYAKNIKINIINCGIKSTWDNPIEQKIMKGDLFDIIYVNLKITDSGDNGLMEMVLDNEGNRIFSKDILQRIYNILTKTDFSYNPNDIIINNSKKTIDIYHNIFIHNEENENNMDKYINDEISKWHDIWDTNNKDNMNNYIEKFYGFKLKNVNQGYDKKRKQVWVKLSID